MIHQLRTYGIFDHNKAAFHDRFEHHAWRIMKKHGFDIVAMWDTEEDGRPVFAYLLSWPDEAAMTAGWAAFKTDEEWLGIRAATSEASGDMVEWIRDHTLVPVAYSPDLIR